VGGKGVRLGSGVMVAVGVKVADGSGEGSITDKVGGTYTVGSATSF
jgi:hypothetical protein